MLPADDVEAHHPLEIPNLQKLVSERTGLALPIRDVSKFSQALNVRMKALHLDSGSDYLDILVRGQETPDSEWTRLVPLLTTGESYFFRDPEQFALITEVILPDLLEKRTDSHTLRIWSAGCSTGEEAFSLAIAAHELLAGDEGWHVLVLGTDINEKALERARNGLFSSWSFREASPDFRKRYFRHVGSGWQLDPAIRSMVTFRSGNLASDTYPGTDSGLFSFDLVVCRNVLIYLTADAVTRIAGKLGQSLALDGYLVTGHAELPPQDLATLRPQVLRRLVVYRRQDFTGDYASQAAAAERVVAPVIVPVGSVDPGPDDSPVAPSVGETDTPTDPDQVETAYRAARSLANLGRYAEAAECCEEAIRRAPTSSEACFLLAQIVEEWRGDTEEAKRLFRRAIYLAPQSPAAYLELAALYERAGDGPHAKRNRLAALKLLEAMDQESTVSPYNEVTARQLVRECRAMVGKGDGD